MQKINDLTVRIYIALMTRKEKGQGVIEYAGAMIVAALIVAAVLAIGRDGMANVYNSIFGGVQSYFTNQANNIK